MPEVQYLLDSAIIDCATVHPLHYVSHFRVHDLQYYAQQSKLELQSTTYKHKAQHTTCFQVPSPIPQIPHSTSPSRDEMRRTSANVTVTNLHRICSDPSVSSCRKPSVTYLLSPTAASLCKRSLPDMTDSPHSIGMAPHGSVARNPARHRASGCHPAGFRGGFDFSDTAFILCWAKVKLSCSRVDAGHDHHRSRVTSRAGTRNKYLQYQ